MANHDEALLRGRRLTAQAPFPTLHQALRIALYDEYAARAFYARMVEAFAAQAPFASLVRKGRQHLAALSTLCARYGVPRPLDPFPAETTLAPAWRANLERAVNGEIANIQLYRHLLEHVVEDDVRRVFRKLQAVSLDHHLPAFQRALKAATARETYHRGEGVPAGQAYVSHGPLSNLLEQGYTLLARERSAFDVAGSLLRSAHPALLAGLLAGGVAAHYLRRPTGEDHFHQDED